MDGACGVLNGLAYLSHSRSSRLAGQPGSEEEDAGRQGGCRGDEEEARRQKVKALPCGYALARPAFAVTARCRAWTGTRRAG